MKSEKELRAETAAAKTKLSLCYTSLMWILRFKMPTNQNLRCCINVIYLFQRWINIKQPPKDTIRSVTAELWRCSRLRLDLNWGFCPPRHQTIRLTRHTISSNTEPIWSLQFIPKTTDTLTRKDWHWNVSVHQTTPAPATAAKVR